MAVAQTRPLAGSPTMGWLALKFKNLKDVVVYTTVIDLPLVAFQRTHHADSNRQCHNLIGRLEHHLPEHQLGQFRGWYHATKRLGEKDERIEALSGNRRENGTSGKTACAVV